MIPIREPDRSPEAGMPQSSMAALVEPELTRPSKMGWWYRLAAPPEPPLSATLKLREAYRRGKLISIALLMLIVIITVVLFTVGVFVNHALIPNLVVMLGVLTVAVLMNRRGKVIVAGILAVMGLDLSLMLNFLSYPQMTVFLLPLLDLLVLPELFAVSLLPPRAVFVDAAVHILFIVASLTGLFPQNVELQALLHTTAIQDALARPIVLQVLVAVITYLWVNSATQAIARADRATTIAALERTMAQQGQREAQQKRELESSIQQIVQVHAQVANGDFSARVPLGQRDTLWEVAGALNNLLARLQRFRQDSLILQQTNNAIARYFQARSQSGNGPFPWKPTGTAVDTLARQHNTLAQPASRLENPHDSLPGNNHMPFS
ncbi:MAG TPA: hypothetical protein VFA10_02380 [Ktedonobacteraceae bacterium]|nr:hypothetical protein [Ktedonobacteraceae bacterium]